MEFIIASAVLAVLGIAYQEAVGSFGAQEQKKLEQIAKVITQQITTNAALMDKLTQAYNEGGQELLTQYLQGAGFGLRSSTIQNAIKSLKADYDKKMNAARSKNAELNADLNAVQMYASKAGSSATANQAAGEAAHDYGNKYGVTNNSSKPNNNNGNNPSLPGLPGFTQVLVNGGANK